jgi:hypothetical protein
MPKGNIGMKLVMKIFYCKYGAREEKFAVHSLK